MQKQEKLRVLAVAATLVCGMGLVPPVAGAPALEQVAAGIKVDPGQVSVSGISSGGFMAHQFHLAHSQHIMGAGIVAGGPYFCARGTLSNAMTKCSRFAALSCQALGLNAALCSPADLGPTTKTAVAQLAQASFAEAKRQASLGGISPLGNLKDDRVYLFSGTYDGVTPQGVVDALFDFYAATDKAALAPGNIDYNRTFPAPHTMVRDGFERPTGGVVGDCTPTPARSAAKNTYIDDCEPIANRQQAQSQCLCPASQAKATPGTPCPPSNKQATCRDLADVDLAGAILKQIYGGPALKAGRVPVPEAAVQAFDQRHVFSHFSGMPYNARQNASMAKEGYVYIPAACKDGRRCRLHVAFHGCQQGGQTDRRPGHAGNLYAKFAGYNEWAKANDIIVLYPQVEARSATAPSNPAGCWDWWGQNYTHEGYHTQRGKQVKAVAQMINILLGGEPRLAVPPE